MLCRANPARRLESNRHARFLSVLADRARHYQPTGSVALIGSFPVEVLMKSAPAIIATRLARATLRNVKIAGPENHLHVPRSARLLERRNLGIKRLPASAKNVSPRDHHIDFIRPRLHRSPNLRHALGQRLHPGRNPRRYRRHADSAAFERGQRRLYKRVIHANASGAVRLAILLLTLVCPLIEGAEPALQPVTVCEVLQDLQAYDGKVVAVVGRFS